MENNKTHIVCEPKVRADSWAAKLTPDQQWKLYRKAKDSDDWIETLNWAKAEFHLDLSPSRSAFFNWKSSMHQLECEQRMEEIAIAAAIGKKVPDDEAIIAAFKMLAVEAATKGNASAASNYAKIADIIQNLRKKQRDFKRDAAEYQKRQKADVETLHSSRRNMLMLMAKKCRKTFEETVETYKKERVYFKNLTDDMYGAIEESDIV